MWRTANATAIAGPSPAFRASASASALSSCARCDLARVVAGAREPRGDERAEAQLVVRQAGPGAVEDADEGLVGAGEVEADRLVHSAQQSERGAGEAGGVVGRLGELDRGRVDLLRAFVLPGRFVRIAQVAQQDRLLRHVEDAVGAEPGDRAGLLVVLHRLFGRALIGRRFARSRRA